jgi:hypothetical protein
MSRAHARMRSRLGRAGVLDSRWEFKRIPNVSRRRRRKARNMRLQRNYEIAMRIIRSA